MIPNGFRMSSKPFQLRFPLLVFRCETSLGGLLLEKKKEKCLGFLVGGDFVGGVFWGLFPR